jgi:dolichyl-phosphate beta-glucosyltransferase
VDLSIIIPAYEESRKIALDVRQAADFLAGNHMTGQIIVVDDGSRDATAHVARSALPQPPDGVSLELIRHARNRGKGHAVRTGVQRATGDFVMFADSGSCVPYEETLRGLALIKSGQCDIAHGSRKMEGCRIEHRQPFPRRVCGSLFRWFVRRIMGIPTELTDTQCGFKIYRSDVARRLYGQAITDGSAFDVEIIMRAREAGYRIREFPLRWSCDPDSRHSIIASVWHFPRELWRIRRVLRDDKPRRA